MERVAPGHHGYPRTSDLIRVEAPEGRMCHQIADVTVRPFLHLLQSDSQTSAGFGSSSLLRLVYRFCSITPLPARYAFGSCVLAPRPSKSERYNVSALP